MRARWKDKKGQAVIETALSLPFLVWLLYYTINAFQFFHTAHIGQKFTAMSLNQRLSHQAKFAVDAEANTLHGREFMAVRYTEESGEDVQRNILDSGEDIRVNTQVGICLEPGCQ